MFSFDGPRPGPAYQIFPLVGCGPAWPINFPSHGRLLGAAHQFFRVWAAVLPSPSPFHSFTARPRPAHQSFKFLGPARPMCCPVLKGEGMCADVFFFLILIRFRFFPSGFRGPAHELHMPTTHIILPHHRPAPMASVPAGGPTPPFDVATPAAAAAAAGTATSDAAIPAAATPASDLSSEESKDNTSHHLLLQTCCCNACFCNTCY